MKAANDAPTPVCDMLGIGAPVIQAPIGSAVTAELVAAVSAAGGLGMAALTWSGVARSAELIRRIRALTDRPFGANLVLAFPIGDILEVCLRERVPIISTFWGDPAAVHDRIRTGGAMHVHTVGSVAEAARAAEVGVDVIVAQGVEAGGHVRGHTSTLTLVPAVADEVGPIPVVAAGGIADGRGLAAVLALGAQAAWIGTRFLTATEAATHSIYRQRIVDARVDETTYTTCFDVGWPDAPHRVLRNDTLRRWEQAGSPAAPHRPGEGDVIATGPGRQCLRYEDLPPLPGLSGDVEALALYAGEAAGLVHDVQPAAEIVRGIVSQASAIRSLGRGTQRREKR
ncbi:2-nitropropane dioxygenase [Actinocatenispora sera]|uniref:2-nitropropane dioxygenase n=1 Tax=Actinocatenispora sera TaxID=390989 RepID=A0A810LC92_9ACTN|nr:2-nitropropane dioxygenase [Actinocatenispora sera]